jgi:hypothetical protein
MKLEDDDDREWHSIRDPRIRAQQDQNTARQCGIITNAKHATKGRGKYYPLHITTTVPYRHQRQINDFQET